MLVHVAPTLCDVAETLCSLNFASRARMVDLAPRTPSKRARDGGAVASGSRLPALQTHEVLGSNMRVAMDPSMRATTRDMCIMVLGAPDAAVGVADLSGFGTEASRSTHVEAAATPAALGVNEKAPASHSPATPSPAGRQQSLRSELFDLALSSLLARAEFEGSLL